MTEPQKLVIETRSKLNKLTKILKPEEGSTFSLDVVYPINQAALKKLSVSLLGMHLEQLNIDPKNGLDASIFLDTSAIRFPKLKKFSIKCHTIKSVYFTGDCFPVLEELNIEEPFAANQETFHLDLPNLQHVFCRSFDVVDMSDFGPSLSRCPKLKTFRSYKLWGLKKPTLVLPNLIALDIHRSDDLKGLKIWAPKVKTLNLRGCFKISEVDLLTEKPAGFSGPEYDFDGEPSEFEVNCANTDISNGTLVNSTRCSKIIRPRDDFWGNFWESSYKNNSVGQSVEVIS